MKNRTKSIFAMSAVLMLSISLFSFSNARNTSDAKNVEVIENSEFTDLTAGTSVDGSFILAWSSDISGILAWDSGPSTPAPTNPKPKPVTK
ncbi:hypothetical protein N0B16_05715 [Chryseobacterium sp. GMJ5]|uniref:Uncharacterized protein n=1 Tax=Chryseobacterium gilvum TaxID=2976534 RepID=A0ABT2VWD1_9FLAO|nr:hypothetical protein [Chryseobacterium gilvum]MCU7613928.1 hypothetical protein [Chryseobacterium gilvum]